MIYRSLSQETTQTQEPTCSADGYLRFMASKSADELAACITQACGSELAVPEQGNGNWYRQTVAKSLQLSLITESDATKRLADFNAIRVAGIVSKWALGSNQLQVNSLYLPLSGDHGVFAAMSLQKYLTGVANVLNASDAVRTGSDSSGHYIDSSIDFSSVEGKSATYGEYEHAVQVGKLGMSYLFLNPTGAGGLISGKELVVISDAR